MNDKQCVNGSLTIPNEVNISHFSSLFVVVLTEIPKDQNCIWNYACFDHLMLKHSKLYVWNCVFAC